MEDKFWSKVDVSDSDACWNWKAGLSGDGYGNYRSRGAHRYAYEFHHGVSLTSKQFVCHSCDNPVCCNPSHLWIGTNQDNMTDMKLKGRRKGITSWFKGGTCKRGHDVTDPRNVKTSGMKKTCRICTKEYQRNWIREKKLRLDNQVIRVIE